MNKRSLWWTVAVLMALEAVARSIQFNAVRNDVDSFMSDPVFFILLHFVVGTGFLMGLVALVNEKRRWPLVVLIVLEAWWVFCSSTWITSTDESGLITDYGPAYPVAVHWISGVVAALGLVAFAWHYWQYWRTERIHESRSES